VTEEIGGRFGRRRVLLGLFGCWFVAASLLAQNGRKMAVAAPSGWSVGEAQGSQVFRPGDLPPGATMVILVPPSFAGSDSRDWILEAAKQTLSPGNGFHAAPQIMRGRSRGGWDFQYVVGEFQRAQQKLVGIVAAVRQADQIGYALAVANSTGTLQKYADAFTSLLESVGIGATPAAPLR
jgi:hypothetical protein